MLTRKEAKILDNLIQGKEVKAIKKLKEYGLVIGKNEINPFIRQEFKKLVSDFPKLKMEIILFHRMPLLLVFAKNRRKFRLKETGLPEASAKRLLKKARQKNLIYMEKKGVYILREDAKPIADFVKRIIELIMTSKVEKELKGFKKAFYSFNSVNKPEAVYMTNRKNNIKGYWLTGNSIFHKYGIHLISTNLFYYSNIKPKIEDAIIHSLAVDQGIRQITYTLAVMMKNRILYGKLQIKKQKFGLNSQFIADLEKFIKTKGVMKAEYLPSWQEVRRVYG